MSCRILSVLTGFVLSLAAFAADYPKQSGDLIVIDGQGKEIVLKKWIFSAGTRKLDWLDKSARCSRFANLDRPVFAMASLTYTFIDRLELLTYEAPKQW